jgi:DedD protein
MMKRVIEERVKHRIIGLAVILSIAAIFAPAIMKKSNQRFDGDVNVSVVLPPKPAEPKVALTEKKAMFASVKVTPKKLPEVAKEQHLPSLAKAESLSHMNESKPKPVESVAPESARVQGALNVAEENQSLVSEIPPPEVVTKTKVAIVKKIAKTPPPFAAKPKVINKSKRVNNRRIKPLAKWPVKSGYGVQLATFANQRNAASLIAALRSKGYKATSTKMATREGTVYKVIVGQVEQREQAQILQRQLASTIRIRGFIVSTGQG